MTREDIFKSLTSRCGRVISSMTSPDVAIMIADYHGLANPPRPAVAPAASTGEAKQPEKKFVHYELNSGTIACGAEWAYVSDSGRLSDVTCPTCLAAMKTEAAKKIEVIHHFRDTISAACGDRFHPSSINKNAATVVNCPDCLAEMGKPIAKSETIPRPLPEAVPKEEKFCHYSSSSDGSRWCGANGIYWTRVVEKVTCPECLAMLAKSGLNHPAKTAEEAYAEKWTEVLDRTHFLGIRIIAPDGSGRGLQIQIPGSKNALDAGLATLRLAIADLLRGFTVELRADQDRKIADAVIEERLACVKVAEEIGLQVPGNFAAMAMNIANTIEERSRAK